MTTLTGIDPDGDSLAFSIVGIETDFEIVGDELRLAAGATIANETEPIQTLVIRATDPGNLTYDETIAVRVVPGTGPPVATSDDATTEEDTPVTIDLLPNDTDPDADPLTLLAVATATNGSVTNNNDGTITFVPATNWSGTETLAYTVSDSGPAQRLICRGLRGLMERPCDRPKYCRQPKSAEPHARCWGYRHGQLGKCLSRIRGALVLTDQRLGQ